MDIALGYDEDLIRFWWPCTHFKVAAELNRSNLSRCGGGICDL